MQVNENKKLLPSPHKYRIITENKLGIQNLFKKAELIKILITLSLCKRNKH